MKLAMGDKLVMIGDSITDSGRTRPAGEGLFDAIGKGYVAMVDALLNNAYPQLKLRVVNQGNSGNTVRDLKARWATDVLALKPDWLSIMIGTNDVWRQHDVPRMTEQHVYPEEYRVTLTELVASTRPQLKGLVLMAPFFMEPNRKDSMRATMDQYGQIMKEIAAKHDCIFVDTQAYFDKLLEQFYSATLGWDRVHATPVGHMCIARAFLNAMEFKWA